MKKSDTRGVDKRVKKLMKEKKKKQEKEVQRQYIEDVMPIVAFDEALECFIMEDGTLLDMFAIITKDLNSTPTDELTYDKYLWEKLYKTYSDDIKIIGFYFHPDTSEQQEYMSRLYYRTESPVYQKLIREKQEELAFVETEDVYMEMQFYLLFFAKNKPDYKEKSISIYSLLSSGFLPSIERITPERKEKIIYQLFNKNMRGGSGE